MRFRIFILTTAITALCSVPALSQPAAAPPENTAAAPSVQQDVITLRDNAVEKTSEQFRKVWAYEIGVIDEKPITVEKVVSAVILLALAIWFSKGLSSLIGRFALPRIGLQDGGLMAIQSILFYLLVVFFALIALRLAHVPLTLFTVIGGALAIGVGFGSQNIMNNFISGLIMLVEQHVRIGDLLDVDGLQGTVKHVGPRSTTIRTMDNLDIVVPNSHFLERQVINWTLSDNIVRFTVAVGVDYISSSETVKKLLLQAAEENLYVLSSPSPGVLLADFAPNTLDFELYCFMFLNSLVGPAFVKSELRFRILELFREHGITLAFPQRDVHIEMTRPVAIKLIED